MRIIYTDSDAGLKASLFEQIKMDLASIPGRFERVLLAVPRQSTFSVEEEVLNALGGKGFFTVEFTNKNSVNSRIMGIEVAFAGFKAKVVVVSSLFLPVFPLKVLNLSICRCW